MQLNDNTFLLYAAKYYDNPSCKGIDEFKEDLDKIKYIKRLFKKYEENGDLKERLILNHLIVLYNVFDNEACTNILIFKLSEYKQYLKPFLVFLNRWERIDDGVLMNREIIERLRNI